MNSSKIVAPADYSAKQKWEIWDAVVTLWQQQQNPELNSQLLCHSLCFIKGHIHIHTYIAVKYS